MQLKNISVKPTCLDTVRWLVIAEAVALFVSTSLTSLFEILLFASVLICAGKLRERMALSLRQPMVVMALAFAGMLLVGMFYGLVPVSEKIDILRGWRKLLLLPVAALVFDEYIWKQRLALAVVGAATVGVLLSFAGLLGGGATIVVHNHATQGIFFAVAAFTAVILVFRSPLPMGATLRHGLALSAILLVANIIFVTPGRGGYLVLLVLATVVCLSLFRGWQRVAFTLLVPAVILVLLSLSSVATQRISVAVHDMRNYEQAERISDMGIRMMMWTNTLKVIRESPLLGHGLGGLKDAYARQVAGLSGWKATEVTDPHNQFLKTAAELGLAGLLVFLVFLASFLRQEVAAPYRILGLGILLAWCASSMFAGHFSSWAEGRFFMIWAGAQLALPFSSRERGRGVV